MDQLKAVGVDGWAYKKRDRYGSILVNLNTGKIMDLLPDREEKSLENWLKTQPTIESKNCLCRLMRSWNVLSHISLEIQRRLLNAINGRKNILKLTLTAFSPMSLHMSFITKARR